MIANRHLQQNASNLFLMTYHIGKGFCQVKKKSKNPRKTRKWVGGSSPNSEFFSFSEMLCFCVSFVCLLWFIFVIHVSKTNKTLDRRWVGGVSPIRVFVGFLIFF